MNAFYGIAWWDMAALLATVFGNWAMRAVKDLEATANGGRRAGRWYGGL